MQDLSARASLAGSVAQLGTAATITIPRSDIEAAIAADEPWDLVLDVARRPIEGDEELHSIAIELSDEELEQLLAEGGDSVTLAFDAEALELAFAEGDVEAHGLREGIAVLAVAITAAAAPAAADAKQAELTGFAPQSTAPAAEVVRPDDRATPRPAPIVSDTAVRPDDRATPRPTPVVADTPVRPDDRAVPRPLPTSAPDTAVRPDDRATPRPVPVSSAPDTAVRPDDRATPRPVPVVPAPVDSPGSGIEIPTPAPGQFVLLAGGVALAIAAAAFAARSRRRVQLT